MDWPLFNICLLTLVIHLIGALAYAARIAGVRTHKIALSFALFNVLVLVSRTSNSFLGPFLAKRMEYRRLVRYLRSGGFAALAGPDKEQRHTPLLAVTGVLILVGLFAFFAVLARMF